MPDDQFVKCSAGFGRLPDRRSIIGKESRINFRVRFFAYDVNSSCLKFLLVN